MLDPQINGSLQTQNSCFVLSHVIRTIEAQSGSERCVATFRGYDYNVNAIVECVGSSIKNHGPSGSLFRFVIRYEFLKIIYQYDVFVWEFEIHGLIVIHNLMGQMIS